MLYLIIIVYQYVRKKYELISQKGPVYPIISQILSLGALALNFTTLWVNSADDKDYFFLIFPRKLDLTFHANCLQWRQFAWNAKTHFLDKFFNILPNKNYETPYTQLQIRVGIGFFFCFFFSKKTCEMGIQWKHLIRVPTSYESIHQKTLPMKIQIWLRIHSLIRIFLSP